MQLELVERAELQPVRKPSGQRTAVPAPDPRERRQQASRHQCRIVLVAMEPAVPRVPAEHLVPAVARQDYLAGLPRELRDEIRRKRRGVGKGLVEPIPELLEHRRDAAPFQDPGVVPRAEPFRHARRVCGLVVLGILEPDRIRVDLRRRARRFADHDARIHPAAQEESHGHVAAQLRAHGLPILARRHSAASGRPTAIVSTPSDQ